MDRYTIHSVPKSVDGSYICPSCRRDFCSDKTGRHYCPSCGLRITIEAPAQAEETHALVAGTDWDKRVPDGKISAFITTTLAGILRPKTFFAEVARSDKMFDAFLYSYWMQVCVTLVIFIGCVGFAPLLQFTSPLTLVAPTVDGWVTYLGIPFQLVWIGAGILAILMTLLWVFVSLAIGALFGNCVLHGLLFLGGAAKKPYNATFRANCYLSALMPLFLIPVLNVVMLFYLPWVMLVALSRAHGVTWLRVFFALFILPFILGAAFIFGFSNLMKS